MTDNAFSANRKGLDQALEAIFKAYSNTENYPLPDSLPEMGAGEELTLNQLAPIVWGRSGLESRIDRAMAPPEATEFIRFV